MTNAELNAMLAAAYNLPKIAKELERMNKLKALEMKLNYDILKKQGGVSLEFEHDVDDIMED